MVSSIWNMVFMIFQFVRLLFGFWFRNSESAAIASPAACCHGIGLRLPGYQQRRVPGIDAGQRGGLNSAAPLQRRTVYSRCLHGLNLGGCGNIAAVVAGVEAGLPETDSRHRFVRGFVFLLGHPVCRGGVGVLRRCVAQQLFLLLRAQCVVRLKKC